ncbi:adenylyltransferase [Helicobacter valdiviensis]|uniref:Molybdopterin-synthase adenylyltransferase n=1 Tax=Helicobacter valdiviensis TaxID=1458358 RepID=A0A2W6NLY9_9HELI|nr:HesA/MoeB/ThiF family protein [Helicobacter valdiviensis]PZT48426.1 adenylyltransferase [Helicobacter valdiviensis]
MIFSTEQLERYNRNILLSGFGEEGQEKLHNAKVLVIGAGGLGSPVLYYLAAAGVGTLGICDGDVVDLSNLQRQIIHTTNDLDKLKVISAKEKLSALNPDLKIFTYKDRINSKNILELLSDYDYVIEATDIFSSKFLINDACVLANKTLIRGSALHFCGQLMSIKPKESACYACLFDTPPTGEVPTGASVGILGAVAGLFGTLQANEAIKIITGVGTPLYNQILTCDVREMDFRKIAIKRNENCRVCGQKGITSLKDY